MKQVFVFALATIIATGIYASDWKIESQDDWVASIASQSNLEIKEGLAVPTAPEAILQSVMKRFPNKRSIQSLTVSQSPDWQN